MKLANCNDHPAENNATLPCWALRHDSGEKVTAQEMYDIVSAVPNLLPVIIWLYNGCDPIAAAKELRIYQQQIDAVLKR